jgi:putative endopeptidase
MAQGWCSVASPGFLKVLAETNPHSAPRFRVNGPLVNLPEFAEAFQCEVGEPMRPAEICEVW